MVKIEKIIVTLQGAAVTGIRNRRRVHRVYLPNEMGELLSKIDSGEYNVPQSTNRYKWWYVLRACKDLIGEGRVNRFAQLAFEKCGKLDYILRLKNGMYYKRASKQSYVEVDLRRDASRMGRYEAAFLADKYELDIEYCGC